MRRLATAEFDHPIRTMVNIEDPWCAAHFGIDRDKRIPVVKSREAVIGNDGPIRVQAVAHRFRVFCIASPQIARLEVPDRPVILKALQSFFQTAHPGQNLIPTLTP